MRKKIICILLYSLLTISLIGCGNTTKTSSNTNKDSKQEESMKDKSEENKNKYIALLESGKTYEQMSPKERTDIIELIDSWEKQDTKFKNKYKQKKEFIEKSRTDAVKKWAAEEEKKAKEEENIPKSVTSDYTAKHGKVLEANKLGKKLTIKFKISPSYSNKATIHQNGFNIEDLILKQGGDQFDEINYWAVADMEDGSESKVISFTLDKNLISAVKNKNIVGNQIVEKANDVWILPSLKN